MKNLNVWVVDDEPGIRSGVNRILRDFTVSYPFMDADIGFNIIEVGTGEEAIEKVKNASLPDGQEKIDIILLDNKLPGIHGTASLLLLHFSRPYNPAPIHHQEK